MSDYISTQHHGNGGRSSSSGCAPSSCSCSCSSSSSSSSPCCCSSSSSPAAASSTKRCECARNCSRLDADGLPPFTMPPFSNMLLIAGCSTAAFAVANQLAHWIWGSSSARYRKLSETEQERYLSYTMSMINSCLVSSFTWSKIIRERKPGGGFVQLCRRQGTMEVVMALLGYFIHDFIASRKVWLKYPAEVVHHLLAIGCCGFGGLAVAEYVPSIVAIGPHVMGIELSTIFLDIMWMLRASKREGSPLYKLSMLLFVASFAFTRVAYLPLSYLHFARKHPVAWQNIGPVLRTLFWCLWLLQVYWFSGIVKMVVKVAQGKA